MCWSHTSPARLRAAPSGPARSRSDIREGRIGASSPASLAFAGCACGILVLGLVLGALSGLGMLIWPARGAGLDGRAALGWAVFFILAAAAQEGVFRGWLLGFLARRLGSWSRWAFWGASMITSLAFAAIHAFSPGQNGIGLVSMGLFGLAMCAAVRRFGTLWWAVGFHVGWDFLLTAMCGFGAGPGARVIWRPASRGPAWLSGGGAGPEASLITLAILGCLIWVLAARAWTEPSSAPKSRSKTRH